MEQLASSTDRLAWQSTREQGMGNGLTVHNDKQPSHNTKRPLVRNYYQSAKYKDTLRVD